MNNKVKVQILDERLHEFGLPNYATSGAAAIDLRAMFDTNTESEFYRDFVEMIDDGFYIEINPEETILIPTGIALDMPENIASVLLPRSGLGHKNGIVLGNLVGLIDSDYHKQVFVSVWNRSNESFIINLGDRISQMMFVPVVKPEFEIVESVEDNGRGGFGHSGIK